MATHDEVHNRESVFSYPRPPIAEDFAGHIQVRLGDYLVADSRRSKRVLETGHPPVFYIPPADIDTDFLLSSRKRTFCEYKGTARYYSVYVPGKLVADAAWYFPRPLPAYTAIEGHVAYYASKMDGCFVDGEQVLPEPDPFYGGWITSALDIRPR